jgi:hypothetical protein
MVPVGGPLGNWGKTPMYGGINGALVVVQGAPTLVQLGG